MARTTIADLKLIFETNLTDEQLTAFINLANRFVTQQLGSSSLSSDVLTDIELFVAAHFASLRDPRAMSEKVLSASVTYQVKIKETGLASTTYGQTAISLDTTNTLLGLNKRRAKIEAVTETASTW